MAETEKAAAAAAAAAAEKAKVDASNANREANRRPLRPGEWACVDAKCAQINSEKRTSCEVCGKGKPKAKSKIGREIGKDAAEKSKGLFSAEDWVCTKCGNVNWARRSTCNVCNAPKLADLEIRTGYGGGYMDRQDVEYIERDDDEEFDEFGRKKKKRGENQKSHNAGDDRQRMNYDDDEPVRKVANYEDRMEDDDEDDDEEEDSDGDLDKYDLTADPELLAFTTNKEQAKQSVGPANGGGERPESTMSSDCTCSCSGGDCSCFDSEEEVATKRPRNERDEKRRSADRDRSSTRNADKGSRGRDRRDDRDRKEHSRDDKRRDRGERSKSRDRERHHRR